MGDFDDVDTGEEKNDKLELQEIALDKLIPNEWNPNTQDDKTFNRLVEEISSVGFIEPIQVVPLDDGTFRILGGEHRFHAARVLGFDKVPCVLLSGARWKDVDLQKFVTVRLNILKGRLNPEKMAKLYSEMADKYGEDAIKNMFAYTDESSWNKLVQAIGKSLDKSGLPKEIKDKFKDVSKEIKTVDGLSTILNKLFTDYGNTLDKNFMVFTFGGKQHVYIAMSKDTKKSVDKIMEYCKKRNVDINDVIAPKLADAVPDVVDEEETSEENRGDGSF